MTKTIPALCALGVLLITTNVCRAATRTDDLTARLIMIGVEIGEQCGRAHAEPVMAAAEDICKLRNLDCTGEIKRAQAKLSKCPLDEGQVTPELIEKVVTLALETLDREEREEAGVLFFLAGDLCEEVTGVAPEEGVAEEKETDWWVLAFDEKKWREANDRAFEQEAPGLDYLNELFLLEANTNQPGQLNQPLPPNGGICLSGLADRWERWVLCAAFEGMHSEPLAKAIAHAKTRGHGPRLDLTEQFLLGELNPGDGNGTGELPSMREQIKTPGGRSSWKVYEKDTLPETISGHVVLLKGKYSLKGSMKIPSDAELWIERGVTIKPTKENSKLMVNGILRIFGPEGEPVQIGSSRRWQGLDYESRIPNLLSDVIVRSAQRGLALRGASLFVTDVEFNGCVIGFQNENTSAWCDSVKFIDCTDHGFWTSVNGGAGSFLSNCTFEGNGLGAETSFRQTLWIWNCEFRKNDIPVRVLYTDAFLYAHNNNFLGSKPFLLNPTKPYDLRRNWWGQKKPNFSKKLSYEGGQKEGDALFSDHLTEKVEAAGA